MGHLRVWAGLKGGSVDLCAEEWSAAQDDTNGNLHGQDRLGTCVRGPQPATNRGIVEGHHRELLGTAADSCSGPAAHKLARLSVMSAVGKVRAPEAAYIFKSHTLAHTSAELIND